ncbi:hypothetical protein SEA_SCHWARTZ33_11 [Gordonia phage Schwartz33]|nr:hypothetical protein SEA_SCHWARTZ33_11 [Gordonia phage Schwartz33]
MASRRKASEDGSKTRRRPATTPDSRENQLIAAAVDLAEKQIREGTVSSQVLTHYLKLGSSRERLEQERLRNENHVLKAKAEAMASAKKVEELYGLALNAMRSYAGQDPVSLGDDEFDEG